MSGTAVAAPTVIERQQLGRLGARLGGGGQAVVHELPGLRLPDVAGPVVYKEYRSAHSSPPSLHRIVAIRWSLDAPGRRRLTESTVWPVRVVVDAGTVTGVLLPQISADFVDRITLLGSGTSSESLREVQNLFVEPALARKLGRPVPTLQQRLAICRDFASTLAFYHDELAVVFGDISATNELYRLDTRPMVLFLDCDGIRLKGQLVGAEQLNTPDWTPPESGALTVATDRYKFGLFVLRCLSPGPGASVRTDPSWARPVLDDVTYDLLVRAVGPDPSGRPPIREWRSALSYLIGEPDRPPRLVEARSDRWFTLPGQPLTLTWVARDALAVEAVAGQRTVRVDGRVGRGTISVTLDASGIVAVRAVNDLGVDHRIVGPIAVVPAPVREALPIPMPRFDWPNELLPVPAPGLPAVPAVAPQVPAGRVTDLLVPQVRAPGQDWPELQPVHCPIDLARLLTGGPYFDFGWKGNT